MEDGGFEIEIIFWEKPKSNVCAFPSEDAQDLNFFDQPKPSAEEIPEGTLRPESVIGSYAVYHKTKVNHRVGDTIYATGKACHTYRPNEVRIGRMKFGQSSLWQGLVATPLVATLATEACAFGNSGLSAGTRKSTPWDGCLQPNRGHILGRTVD